MCGQNQQFWVSYLLVSCKTKVLICSHTCTCTRKKTSRNTETTMWEEWVHVQFLYCSSVVLFRAQTFISKSELQCGQEICNCIKEQIIKAIQSFLSLARRPSGKETGWGARAAKIIQCSTAVQKTESSPALLLTRTSSSESSSPIWAAISNIVCLMSYKDIVPEPSLSK